MERKSKDSRRKSHAEVASPGAPNSASPSSSDGSGYKKRKPSSRASAIDEMPKIDERAQKSRRTTTAGDYGPGKHETGKKHAASPTGSARKESKKHKVGKDRASHAGIFHQEATKAKKHDDKGKQSKADDKGKGRVSVLDPDMEARGTKHGRQSLGRRSSIGGSLSLPEYDSVKGSFRFHEDVSPLMPEAKRLHQLLDSLIEAEQKNVASIYTGKNSFISEAFDEVASNFMLESERFAIAQSKKTANTIARPAQTAFARGEEEPAKPNPLNDARTMEELALRKALVQFEEEEKEWHRMEHAASSMKTGATFQPLPPAGGAVSSTHSVMQELSIADRNLLCSRDGEELVDLLAWSKGFIESGLDRVRSAIHNIQDKSKQCSDHHKRLVSTLRETTEASCPGSKDPKRLLRAVIAQ